MERKIELTYARGIFCIMVVFVHAITGYLIDPLISTTQTVEKRLVGFFQISLLCATPCFIMLSETLLGLRYSTFIPKNFLVKRAKYILVPYVILGVYVTCDKFMNSQNKESFWNLFKFIVLEGNFFGWFIIVIFQFFILHKIFYKVLNKSNPLFLLAGSLIISALHSYFMYFNQDYHKWWETYYPLYPRTIILYWLFYFIVGFYVGKYYDLIFEFIKRNIWILFSAWILALTYLAFNFFHLKIFLNESLRFDLLIYSCLSFLLVIYGAKFISRFHITMLYLISEISFFIYLAHQIIIKYISLALSSFVTHPIIYIFISVIFTIGFCIGLAIMLSFIPYVRIIVGRNTLYPMVLNNYGLKQEAKES
ncbi:acyltransferase family protein [Staphylococcus carnosus]|uniref:Probable poly-beta-1,6-N-acetyl-D-glucosamine export protein n=2 Tax=Staphylococcus carnosus TaxID=1281 RepID=B9DJT9_STACT|nr:acyltransferase family protein [Staphylococcus carnosus]QPT02864.1 acyltransferase family protein [Staphylococcus carnosus]UQA67868.1 acyltransferase family protein [Staphylococcus carnosus]UTB77312.1 hypothetical protein A2I62_01445 [Staphylococcus carnosus]UTB86856.1 hypothetical protein A2I63_01435 [Staphylococcus carnosus]UTB89206.1 hypothetical protein A2I64_01440 [Staphylococcus carnosus]